MNNNLPKELSDKQELQRQQTINKVLRAIDDLQSQGCRLSIKNLMDYTGLSRSTFSKPHVRELLTKFGYSDSNDEKTVELKKQSRKRKLNTEIKNRDERIQKLIMQNRSLQEECELLRGRLFLLMQQQQIQ